MASSVRMEACTISSPVEAPSPASCAWRCASQAAGSSPRARCRSGPSRGMSHCCLRGLPAQPGCWVSDQLGWLDSVHDVEPVLQEGQP